MDPLPADGPGRPASSFSSSPPLQPSNDDIEAVIQMATASHSSDGRPMKDTRTQLFVGNLPYRVRWQDLKDLFRKAGTVLRADVSLGPDNRSRGYGTVLLATAEDAGRAVDMFNGYSWQTRILEVRPDRLPPDYDHTGMLVPPIISESLSMPTASSSRAAADFDYNLLMGLERPSSSNGGGRNLFVGNLPFHCQWQDLKDLFRQAGTIVRADVAMGQDGRSRGFGTVAFATDYDADRAVKMFNGYEFNGRQLKVHFDRFTHAMHPATTPASPVMSSFPPSQSNNFSLMSSSPFLNHSNSRPSQIVVPAGYTLDFGPASAPSSPFEAYPPQLQRGSLEQQPSSRRPSFPQSSQDIDPVRHLLNSVHLSDKRTSSSSSTDSKLSQTSSSNSNLSLSSNNTTPPPDQTSSSPSSAPSGTHPNHPGHISIPSLPPVPFSMAMHNMSPVMMPMAYSPLYHPGNMSPMHHPGLVTPHGIPITPSMPPFTFASHLHPMPSPTMGSFPVSTPQPAPSTSNGSLNHENINNNNHQQGPSTPTHPGGPIPFTPFSPGIALSPGAFWAGGSGNPYINAAVGAPVHGGYQSFGPGTPTGGFYFAPSPAGMPPQMPMEPGGYFDNVFMMGSSMGMGALEGEIMKDKEPVVVDEEKKEKESTPNSDLGDRRGWEGRATEETEQSATKSATQTNSTPPSPMSKRPLVLRPESDPMKPTLFNHMTNSSE